MFKMEISKSRLMTILLFLLPSITLTMETGRSIRDSKEILSRKRRYVTFPEGASFSMAACLTVGVLGQPSPGIFTWGLNWGIAYELPNETLSIKALKRTQVVPRPVIARRYRRDLYHKLELVMNDMGYNGRECIFRALCEAAQRLMPKGNTIMEELFRTVFSLPLSKVLPSEPLEHHMYDAAHRSAKDDEGCHLKYRKCQVSLLDLALGHYSPKKKINFHM